MGVGRFVYTPLLVEMRAEGVLSTSLAGILASANLAGYLVGALLAMLRVAGRHRTRLVQIGSVVVVLTTAMMALPPSFWLIARFITGVASGIVFVLTISLVLDVIVHEQSRSGAAVAFSGIGIGIALSGLLVAPFVAIGGSRAAWLGLAAFSAIALAIALPLLPRFHPEPHTVDRPPDAKDGSLFGWLAFVYGIEGGAYIIPATFLVAMIAETPSIARFGAATWILVGLVAAPSMMWWGAATRRWGQSKTLVLACIAQTLSMLAPFVLPSAAGAVVLAVGLGGTFIGIAALAMALARNLRPANANGAIGLLTALYGIGQIVAPLIATRIVLVTGSYRLALLISAVALGIATIPFTLRAKVLSV